MRPHVVAIIQARTGSKRFPNKVHADLNGSTVLEHVVMAVDQIVGVDDCIVAWPESTPHRGENDVLGRYADVARQKRADVIVRITGDCPLLDPQVGTLVLQTYLERFKETGGYASNVYPRRTWPDGQDVEVFSFDLLWEAYEAATHPYDREHVTPYIQTLAMESRRLASVELPVDWSHVRLTVDTKEDLEWLKVAIRAPRNS